MLGGRPPRLLIGSSQRAFGNIATHLTRDCAVQDRRTGEGDDRILTCEQGQGFGAEVGPQHHIIVDEDDDADVIAERVQADIPLGWQSCRRGDNICSGRAPFGVRGAWHRNDNLGWRGRLFRDSGNSRSE
jgi:hypothetical protein